MTPARLKLIEEWKQPILFSKLTIIKKGDEISAEYTRILFYQSVSLCIIGIIFLEHNIHRNYILYQHLETLNSLS